MLNRLKDLYYRNLPMVKYWKTAEATEAKVTTAPEGHAIMFLRGEKYPFPGYPRGTLLFGKLSPLKHWIKNKVFNDVWAMLDEGRTDAEIALYLRNEAFPYVFDLGDKCKYDMVPREKLVPAVREIERSMSVIGMEKWKDIITFIFQEDDAYRMRFQWLAKFFPKHRKPTFKDLDKALGMMEHAETVSDMKERARLVRRVLGAIYRDPGFKATIDSFLKETNWKKVGLSEADKYYFRAKYFRVDYPEYSY